MNTITHNQRYLPHELSTKYYSVKLYRNGCSVSFVCRRYKIPKSLLMRWNKKFDGRKKSLIDKSHKPLSKHPNAHTKQELKWIRDYHRRNPHMSVCELYGAWKSTKATRDIRALFIEFLLDLVIVKKKNPQKMLINLGTMIHLPW